MDNVTDEEKREAMNAQFGHEKLKMWLRERAVLIWGGRNRRTDD